jgi:ABC-2 type transport system permease protein
MRNSWIIAKREFWERVGNRNFKWMLFIGPLTFLLMLLWLFKAGDEGKNHLKVLIADPADLLEQKIVAWEGKSVSYYFIGDYLEIDEFRDGAKYKEFDALIEVNEKVLMNKKVFVFHREQPSSDVKMQLKFQVERRVEEVLIENFTNLSVDAFRQIKQPLNVDFRNVYDPKNEASNTEGYVGLIFGLLILSFVFLFGMAILRSTAREKSNRIVEVILASVQPRDLMLGKILGIGLAALIQIGVWSLLIGLGLWAFRTFYFPDLFAPENWEGIQVSADVQRQMMQETLKGRYNAFVELVYERIQFGSMMGHGILFFVASYLFYGSFFSSIGAMSGTESDGQQFVLPLLGLMGVSVYCGFIAIYLPESTLVEWAQFIPFTAPTVVLVKIAQGYPVGTYYFVLLSLLGQLLSAWIFLWLAGRIYKNGILRFGHQTRWKHWFQWMRG